MRWLKYIIATIGTTTILGSAPLFQGAEMPLVGSFTYECNGVMRTAELEDGSIVQADFDPEPCTGTHAYSVFIGSNGDKVYDEITLDKYKDIGGKDCYSRNPKKNESQSAFGKAFAPRAEAAIAFDAAYSEGLGGSGTSFTFAHTVTGSNTFLAVHARCALVGFTSVAYNSDGMTKQFTGNQQTTALFYLFGADTGANNVVITCDGSAADIYANASSYTGAGSPLDANGETSNSGTSITLTVTATSSDAWAIGGFRSDAGGDWTMTSGTKRTGGNHQIADSAATCSSCTLAGTHDTGNNWLRIITIAPAPAAAAATFDDTSFEIIN